MNLSTLSTYSVFSGLVTKMLKLNIFKRSSPIHEVLFYGGENEQETKEVGLNNLFCIYYVIVHASTTVDVCVPSLVSETIAKCLLTLQQKNRIKIRVVIHNSKKGHNARMFSKHGIEVRVIKSEDRLEHDFILIDACDQDAVAVLGSLDYETSRVNQNRDATVLTSETIVVHTLKREFERVWNSAGHSLDLKENNHNNILKDSKMIVVSDKNTSNTN